MRNLGTCALLKTSEVLETSEVSDSRNYPASRPARKRCYNVP